MNMSSRLRGIAAPVFLFALNAWITLPLFFTDFTKQMGSIEAAYIGLARYIAAHFSNLSWFPLWYNGIPYPDTYPPLLHWMCGAVVAITHCSPGLAHHLVTASIFSLGPVTMYWMIVQVSKNRGAAFAAALGYSLISPACLLVREVSHDAGGVWAARRLHTLVIYGEGPHVTSLCLLPLAIGMLHVAITRRRPAAYFGAALAIAAVPMSNWIGAMALAFGVSSLLLAYTERIGQWITAGLLGVWAYAVALPWMSPATIRVIQANAPRVANNFESTTGQRVFLLATVLGLLVAAWLMHRFRVGPPVRFALLFTYLTSITALGKYWFKLSLVPQPERYHLEMDMAMWTAAALLLWPLLIRPRVLQAACTVAAALVIVLAYNQHRAAREWEQPIDITTTIEYKSARWVQANLPDARVFAPGTIGFWWNAFSDNPQITGGFDNGILNPMLPHVIFQVYAGEKQSVTVDLMKAYGVDAVIAGGKDSAEFYHPMSHAEKFAGLTELWRDKGDAVYAVPRRQRSLAHVIPPSALVYPPPVAYDTTAIQPYLAAIEDPLAPAATLKWFAPDSAGITAPGMQPSQLISVQISFDKGWEAYRDGSRLATWRDQLGQMTIAPQCNGNCTVELRYTGGAEHRAASAICMAALLLGILWTAISYVKSIRLQRG